MVIMMSTLPDVSLLRASQGGRLPFVGIDVSTAAKHCLMHGLPKACALPCQCVHCFQTALPGDLGNEMVASCRHVLREIVTPCMQQPLPAPRIEKDRLSVQVGRGGQPALRALTALQAMHIQIVIVAHVAHGRYRLMQWRTEVVIAGINLTKIACSA